ncbi:MAG TPA: Asp23/Gls24 family envelope stress response protein [Chloroflexota bacterium]|nr:Asp23/Gls24 family envelope stress response protein [Chloroflexota bacterium]
MGFGETGEGPVDEEAIELDRKPGRIEVSPKAISMAASRVVLECYGVVGIAGRKLKHGRAVLLEDHAYAHGIIVSMRGNEVVVDVYVVIEYGTRISEVAHNVMHAVGETLRRMLGSAAVRVNVNVQGLRLSG